MALILLLIKCVVNNSDNYNNNNCNQSANQLIESSFDQKYNQTVVSNNQMKPNLR